MSNNKYNFPNAQKVQIFEQIDTYIENNYQSNPEIKATMVFDRPEVIADLKALITDLQTKHPNVTTKAEALAIIEAEFTEIKTNSTHKFNKLGKQTAIPNSESIWRS